MKARFATTIFCECNRGMEHVGSDYLRCNNPACPHFGKRFEIPTIELVPLATEAVAGDLGLDLETLVVQSLKSIGVPVGDTTSGNIDLAGQPINQ